MPHNTAVTKQWTSKLALYHECKLHKIMVKKVTFVGFRGGAMIPTLQNSVNGNTEIDGRGERNRKSLGSAGLIDDHY